MTQREWEILDSVAYFEGKWPLHGEIIFFNGKKIFKKEFLKVCKKYINSNI